MINLSAERMSFTLDKAMSNTLIELATKKSISVSALIRKFISIGLEQELAAESVDYIRTQLNAEIKSVCTPQFDRLAKLEAKIGYQTIPSFYLLVHLLSMILPAGVQKDVDELKLNAKMMAISYLKLSEKEFLEFTQNEDIALDKLMLN